MALALIFKSVLLIAAAALATLALRRASAASRHLVWLAALAALLVLPLATFLAPAWRPTIPVQPTALNQPLRTVLTVTANESPSNPFRALPWIYAAGAALLLARLALAHLRTIRLARHAAPLTHHAGIPVRTSQDLAVPLLCLAPRPTILLPHEATNWPTEKLDAVLRHEAAHAARADCHWRILASLARALYWPLPWVWLAASRLETEAELASDDLVLADGRRASGYAQHLIEIARALHNREPIPQGGIPMARLSDLELRLRAMLQPNANRRPATRRFISTLACAALALAIPLALIDTPAFAAGDGITGVVKDPSGAVVPRARVSITFLGGDRREVVWTDAVGEFNAAPLPDGDYNLTVAKPGFALLKLEAITVGNGKNPRLDVTLQAGRVSESLTVTAQGAPPPPPPPAPGAVPQRIKVGGNVQAVKLLKQVRPSYPAECKAQGVQGTVLLKAVIGKTGDIVDLQPVNQFVDARLTQAAIDAVKQWQYTPTLLNGEPVEVITEIEINFTLAQ